MHRLGESSFFRECSKSNADLENERKIKKDSFVSEIIVSELVALNYLYKEDNTSHRQSMSEQTILRICTALT